MRGMKYLVVVEQGDSGFSAYVPDLPGCVAAADNRKEVVVLRIDGEVEDAAILSKLTNVVERGGSEIVFMKSQKLGRITRPPVPCRP